MDAAPSTRCCIVGGGPAGMMLGLLLARAGVNVVVLEKHGDFLRDFRGDTVHPSTMMALQQIGLLEKFERLPQHRIQHLAGIVSGHTQELIDFRGLAPFDHLALVPQWDLLALLAAEGRRYPNFDLRMRRMATGLIEEGGRVVGVTMHEYVKSDAPAASDETLRADLVIACDGRHSTLRAAAKLAANEYGAPMDVLWFRMPRADTDPQETFGIVDSGHMMVLLNRNDYWQAAFLVPKGGDAQLRTQPIEVLRSAVSTLASFLADRTSTIESWDDVKTLEVQVDCLGQWHQPGLLLIGDAAHAMSPIGGVGINLAIQDAVAAANALAELLRGNDPIPESALAAVQARRMKPTRLVQRVQLTMQKRIISRAIAQSGTPLTVPPLVRWLLQFRRVRNIPAWLFGYGYGREDVRSPVFPPPG
ncbi:MAG: FAD-dependent oxidoreductase [Dokdonella sp.]|uniref:FAD-dependent oxidoreductase n=1 Tax=Dokdonella sp. TaxID=2291710 RepID=UPI00326625FD